MAIPHMQPIPERCKATCEFCHGEFDIRDRGVYQYTKGWVMSREGGGGHSISLPEREPRWAHGLCVEYAVKGLAGQSPLFGER